MISNLTIDVGLLKPLNHSVKNNRIAALEKLHSKKIYSLIISQNISTLISQQYLKTLFPHMNLDWKLIYLLPSNMNTSLRTFQYKVLNNVLRFPV